MTSPISFEPHSHTYKDKDGAIYKSATQFLELFHSKFEDVEDFWLFYKAIQYASNIDKESKIKKFNHELSLKIEEYLIEHYGQPFLFTEEECLKWTKLGVWKFKADSEGFKEVFKPHERLILEVVSSFVKEYWVSENVKSTTRGTAFHNEKEDSQFNLGVFEYNQVKYKIDTDCDSLFNLKENCVYPELRLYNTKYKIAGTSDQVLVLPGKKVIIRDWKGLALDTPLATKEGWSTMGEIKAGDTIFDGDGNLTKVKNVSEIHHNPCYKITFDTNDTIIADHEHRWEVELNYKTEVFTTEELLNHIDNNTLNIVNPYIHTEDLNPILRSEYEKVNQYRDEYLYFKSIELIDTVPTKCLEVESPTHTYLAGKTFIKTHNTNKEIKTTNKYDKFYHPISHLENCEYVKYSLQLSLYGYMLEQFGFLVDDIEFEHFVLDENNQAISSTIYKCAYLKDEVIAMLDFYLDSLS